MKNIKFKNTAIFILVGVVTIVLYAIFLHSPAFKEFYSWTKSNRVLFIAFLFVFKVASILYPPLTGGTLTLGSIPFLGWQTAYLVDFSGSVSGGVVAYFLGKKYGYKLLGLFFDENVVNKIKSIKIKPGRDFETVFVFRFLFGSTILEAVYYGAGILKVNFISFITAAASSHILFGLPLYFVVKSAIEGKNILFVLIPLSLGILFFLKFRKRYFE